MVRNSHDIVFAEDGSFVFRGNRCKLGLPLRFWPREFCETETLSGVLPMDAISPGNFIVGSVSIPLLRDRHTHPFLYASWIDGLSIHDAGSKREAIARIEAHESRPDEILIVQGWLDSQFQISPADLASLGPTTVFNLSLHGLVMNGPARVLIERELGDFECHWSDQQWLERNLRKILNAFAILNGNVDRLKRYYDWLHQEQGVIYAEEMLLAGEREIDIFREADLLDRTRFWCSLEMWQTLSEPARQQIYGMKIFADGALGVRTAAVATPFDNGDQGMLLYSDVELHNLVVDCIATEKAIAIHAIGDRAIDQVVALILRLRKETGFENEVRIEHAQLISPDAARIAKEANIILSMQPNFSIDSVEYADRMPQHYCKANNPFRMLIDEVGFVPGQDLIFGSDGMPSGAAEAIRQSLAPPYPYRQRLKIKELVAGYCDSSVFAHPGMVQLSTPKQKIKWQAWGSGASITFAPSARIDALKADGTIEDDQILLHEIVAATGEDAMTQHHQKMGWEPYKPVGEPSACPNKCGGDYYPDGFGDCPHCGNIG